MDDLKHALVELTAAVNRGFVRMDDLQHGLVDLAAAVSHGFAQNEGRFDRIEFRLDRLEDRVSRVEVRLEDGFAALNRRLAKLERPRRR